MILEIISSLKKNSIVWQEVFDDKVEVRTAKTPSQARSDGSVGGLCQPEDLTVSPSTGFQS